MMSIFFQVYDVMVVGYMLDSFFVSSKLGNAFLFTCVTITDTKKSKRHGSRRKT